MASYIQANNMLLWEHRKGVGCLTDLKRQGTFSSSCLIQRIISDAVQKQFRQS